MQTRYSPEFRERAVRLVFENQVELDSQCAAMNSIAGKVGCTAEMLQKWMGQAGRDQGLRDSLTTSDRERPKALERENRELKRANEILHKASAYSPRRSSIANRGDGGVHRCAPGEL